MIQQCINCQTVWEDFNSLELKSFCSAKCEKEYEKYLKKLEKEIEIGQVRNGEIGER